MKDFSKYTKAMYALFQTWTIDKTEKMTADEREYLLHELAGNISEEFRDTFLDELALTHWSGFGHSDDLRERLSATDRLAANPPVVLPDILIIDGQTYKKEAP